jgi:hypothetical protein
VGLVEDEDLVAVTGRSKQGTLTQVTGIINTVVRSSVDLNYIERAASVSS